MHFYMKRYRGYCQSGENVPLCVTAMNLFKRHKISSPPPPYFFASSLTRAAPLTAGCSTWAAMPAEPDRQDGRLMKAGDSRLPPWGGRGPAPFYKHRRAISAKGKQLYPNHFRFLAVDGRGPKRSWGWRLQSSRGQLWALTNAFKGHFAQKLNLQPEIPDTK